MIYDYAVIGAGAAGMSAALVLAKLGATVVLIEKSPQLAPLLRGFSRHGVYFDTGFHSTGGWADGGPLQVLLRYLGIADQLQLAPYRADEFDGFHCTHPHWQFQFPQGWVPLEERLRREFPSEQVAIRDYLRTIRTYYQSLPYVNVQAAFDP
ncbi:MAG: FAD-dependent oxidoreductase, partial [bacterium]